MCWLLTFLFVVYLKIKLQIFKIILSPIRTGNVIFSAAHVAETSLQIALCVGGPMNQTQAEQGSSFIDRFACMPCALALP